MPPQLHTYLPDDAVRSLLPCRQRLGRHHGHQAALRRLRLVTHTVYNRRHERARDFEHLLDQLKCHYHNLQRQQSERKGCISFTETTVGDTDPHKVSAR